MELPSHTAKGGWKSIRYPSKIPAHRRKTPTATFPSPLPVLRIDHLFVSPEIKVTDVFAPFDPLTRLASDHLPLVMDFTVA